VPAGAPAALDLMFSALIEVSKSVMRDLARVVRVAEDALIDFGSIPDSRVFVADRRRAVMLRRQLIGLRSILHRLELNDDLPEAIRPTVEKVVQHIVALDGDIAEIYQELQQLREEVDMQTVRRTNQNLYVLSTLSAVLLPPTLVSSFFGMNTGGLPWMNADWGTWSALLLMFVAMVIVVLWLYRRGFFRD
jgi:zinc transporter